MINIYNMYYNFKVLCKYSQSTVLVCFKKFQDVSFKKQVAISQSFYREDFSVALQTKQSSYMRCGCNKFSLIDRHKLSTVGSAAAGRDRG